MQAGYSQRALDDILRHNKPLLSEDATIFQNEAAVLQKDVAKLKARMDALIVELSALHVQHTAASHALQQRNSVHAPIHRLPDEVILHIFRLCIPDIVGDSCLDVQGVRFRIFRVCRWWRDIATNSPSLWAVLVVRSWPTRRDPAVYAISRYLSLSRDQPLQIYFSYPEMQNHGIPYDSTDACSVVFRDIMNLLDSHWHRWETFSVSNKTHYQWRPVEWGHGTAFPRLREISICDEDPFRLLLLAPTLTKVKITGLQRLDRFNHLTGLTHLHIFESKESFRPYPIKDILERHASLTQLHFVSATRTHVFEERIVEHANLEQLVLSSLQHLNCISIPSLKGLHMSSYAVPSSSGVDSLIAFVHRSQCALRTVTLDTRALYQEIDKIISSFLPLCAESLTQLKLVVWPSGPNVEVLRRLLGALTRQVSSAGLLPHLTSFAIELHIGRAIHPILPAIAAMLKSRRDVELSKRWKVDVLDDVGMSIEDHYEATDRALFTAEVESLREGGLLFWTTENMSGNSFYTAPWLEEQKRFPLKTPSGLLAPKHRPLYPPSSWMGRFEDDDSDMTDLSDDDDIWSSPIHPQQHTGTSNSLGVGVSATGSSHPFQIYPIDHYGVDLGSLSNTDFGHVLPPPLQFEGTHSLDNPASDVYSEFSFDETGPPVIPPSPIASDTDDESVLLPRTLDFMDAPGSPSQFPSPFNHPLAHFTQQTVGAVPPLAQAQNPSTREGSVLLQDVGCQLAGVENGDHCLFGDTDELGQPLSPLMLSPTLEVGSSSMSI